MDILVGNKDIPVGDMNILVRDIDIPVRDMNILVGNIDIPVRDMDFLVGNIDDDKIQIRRREVLDPAERVALATAIPELRSNRCHYKTVSKMSQITQKIQKRIDILEEFR